MGFQTAGVTLLLLRRDFPCFPQTELEITVQHVRPKHLKCDISFWFLVEGDNPLNIFQNKSFLKIYGKVLLNHILVEIS